MTFDFDAPVERAGSDSTKWAKYAGRDILPLWVADMDFAAPPPVLAALRQRLDHGVLGYNQPTAAQVQAVVEYLAREFAYSIEPEWIVWLPGLVSGLNIACRAVGETGDAVASATPIYPPFLSAPRFSQRRPVGIPLVCVHEGGRQHWLWDFPALDAGLRESRAKLFLLCHPHNPVGRAWDADELWQLAALAEKYDLVICSDEIHNGLLLDPAKRHRPFAALAPEIEARTITLMAPSKTFNIPGLGAAFAIISDPSLRRRFHAAMQGIVPHVSLTGLVATDAALRLCGDWHRQLIAYLRANAQAVTRAVVAIDGLSIAPIEATYLAWIDARPFVAERGIENPAAYFENHGLGLSDGADFGQPGYVRLNFGTRRALLDEALRRLAAAG